MDSTDRKYYIFALKIMFDFGVTIAIPAVIFSLAGQYFDAKYDKAPLFLILFLVTALLITMSILIKKAKNYGNLYQQIDKKDE
jgi:F0F1-type ATP synthase assembly protein I